MTLKGITQNQLNSYLAMLTRLEGADGAMKEWALTITSWKSPRIRGSHIGTRWSIGVLAISPSHGLTIATQRIGGILGNGDMPIGNFLGYTVNEVGRVKSPYGVVCRRLVFRPVSRLQTQSRGLGLAAVIDRLAQYSRCFLVGMKPSRVLTADVV